MIRQFLALSAAMMMLVAVDAHAQAAGATTRDTLSRTSVGGDLEYVSFGGAIQDWRFADVSLAHRSTRGSIIGRVNLANRFGQNGTQVEGDAYPRLGGNGVYAYINLGYSASSIFPRWRSGAELYTNLPNAFEASLGYRQLRFEGTTPVTLFTGTVGKYTGNYWFSIRPYVADKSNGTSGSATLTGRRYFADADNYIGARIGYGSTPTDRLTEAELARTSSTSADVHGSHSLAARTFGTWSVAFEDEQLPAGLHRRRWDFTAGLRYDLP